MPECVIRWFIRWFCEPYFNLGDYMERWWVIKPRSWLPFSVRIHHIKRSDIGPDLHCHPWWFWTWRLRNSYIELFETIEGFIHSRRCGAGSMSFHSANFKHRLIVDEQGEGVWTLFVHGRKTKEWGFYPEEGFVHWTKYDKMEQRINMS